MKIGIFDSGLGGLVITKACINALPAYDYVYFGDTRNLPYGEKTSGQILAYSLEAMRYLISQQCSLIVIACNTATSIALRYIQQRFIPAYAPEVKVLGVVIPTVETAIDSGEKKIGVAATRATVRSGIYATELHKLNPELWVKEVATPELVPAIEHNNFAAAEEIVLRYLPQFAEAESVILGCTHYPLVKHLFRRYLPANVKVVSQDELMGAKLADYLRRHSEIETRLRRGAQYRFVVSSLNEHYRQVASTLFADIPIEEISA